MEASKRWYQADHVSVTGMFPVITETYAGAEVDDIYLHNFFPMLK